MYSNKITGITYQIRSHRSYVNEFDGMQINVNIYHNFIRIRQPCNDRVTDLNIYYTFRQKKSSQYHLNCMCSLILLSIWVITKKNIDNTGIKLEFIRNPVLCCISNKCHLYTTAYNAQHCLCLTKLRHFLFLLRLMQKKTLFSRQYIMFQ